MAKRLFSRLMGAMKIVNPDGTATNAFALYDQKRCEVIEAQFANLQETVDALAATQAAAAAAQGAATVATAAAGAAQASADSASAAATSATTAISQIESGTLDLAAVKIGGTRFVNDGSGNLIAEP